MSKRSTLACVACQPLRTAKNKPCVLTQTTAFPAPWLQDLHRQAIPRHCARFQSLEANGFAPSTPHLADVVVKYTSAKMPKKVVYWASGPCCVTDSHLPKGAECAYGDYCNMGVAVRKGKTLELVLQTPRPYVARPKGKQQSQLWCRHVHFVEVDDKTNKVSTSNKNVLYTLGVFPCTLLKMYKGLYECKPLMHTDSLHCAQRHSMFVSFEQYMMAKRAGAVGVNAIADSKYPPISTDDMVISWRGGHTTIGKQLERDARCRVDGRHTAFVVYCANDTCLAAQELIHKMYELGYCNVFYLKHGMREAREKTARLMPFLRLPTATKSKPHNA